MPGGTRGGARGTEGGACKDIPANSEPPNATAPNTPQDQSTPHVPTSDAGSPPGRRKKFKVEFCLGLAG